VSDAGPTEPNQPKSEAIQNLFDLMAAVSTPDTVQHFEDRYSRCEIRYGDMKKQLAEDMIAATDPIRSRIRDISADGDYIRKVVRRGAEKAGESARKTLREVREIIGVGTERFFTPQLSTK